MKINIKKCLYFLDEKSEDNPLRGHATAFVGFLGENLNAAAFAHYGNSVCNARVEILPDNVTTGRQRGPRLDRWILWKDDKSQILYQTEIKNWSSWAIGSGIFPLDASPKEIGEMAKLDWIREFHEFYNNKSRSDMKARKVNKVLERMVVPDRFRDIKVKPLVLHWRPIHAGGRAKPMWSYPVDKLNLKFKFKVGFKRISYFSVSLYFRQLLKSQSKKRRSNIINLDVPQVEERLRLIKVLTRS